MREQFQIRRGTPQDVDELVQLHFRVFDARSHYLLLLGRPFLFQAYCWYCSAPTAFTFIVEAENKIVGCATVSEDSYTAVFTHNWLALLGAFCRRPSMIMHPIVVCRLREIFVSRRQKSLGKTPHTSGYLAYLAVDRSARLNGLGKLLIEACISESSARNWTRLLTGAHSNNTVALSLYSRLGFVRAQGPNPRGLVKLYMQVSPTGGRNTSLDPHSLNQISTHLSTP